MARRLFSAQSTPWEETLFLARWQSQLPGVGSSYQVSTDMLRGLAVSSSSSEGDERFWKYMPAEDILKTEVEEAFETLFSWKDQWLMDELQPYLDAIVDAGEVTQADLLIQFTKVVVEEFKGIPVKYYKRR